MEEPAARSVALDPVAILDALPDGVLIVDRAGLILYASARIADLSGYTPQELERMKVEDLLPDRYRGIHERHRWEFGENPHVRPMGGGLDLRLLRKDQAELPIDVWLAPMADGVTLAAVRDISERRSAELERVLLEIEEAVAEVRRRVAAQ